MARRKKKIPSTGGVHAVQVRRLFYFAFCLIGGFLLLGYRLYDLQVLRHEELWEAARNNTERLFLLQPRRGDIVDIRGNLLATSKPVNTVCADPHLLGTNYIYVARALAPLLGETVEELKEKLRPRLITYQGKQVPLKYVVLQRKVEVEKWHEIEKVMDNLTFGVDESQMSAKERAPFHRIRRTGVFEQEDQIRFYPNQSLAAHILGFVGMHERETILGAVQETTGKAGLELILNEVLTGIEGWRRTETDSRRREVVAYRDQDVAPRSGLNAVLSIDSGIQHIVEDELARAMKEHTPISVSCIVVRPSTGEVLAMANLPTFNPNDLGRNVAARRNRAVTDLAEPGSTFKVVVVSAALNDGLVELHDTFFCENGYWRYGGRPLRDHDPFGMLSVKKIISKSSNIGAAKIGMALGEERLYEYIRAFGFGQRSRIPLPGEAVGIIRPVEDWTKLSITRIPMGHEISCTPLQMVMAMAAIANGGELMRPLLVDRFEDAEGNIVVQFRPQVVRRVISEKAAAEVNEALKAAVSTNGTAFRAIMEHYTVAGKTGTAQKLVGGRYVRNKHFSSFIGYFPADDPELCITVVMDEPKHGYYGGEAAAPVFRRIAARAANYLAIPPDKHPQMMTSRR